METIFADRKLPPNCLKLLSGQDIPGRFSVIFHITDNFSENGSTLKHLIASEFASSWSKFFAFRDNPFSDGR